MNNIVTKYIIWVVRFLGVILGLFVFWYWIESSFFRPGLFDFSTSLGERLYLNIPFFVIGTFLLLPYRCIKNKIAFYIICLLPLLLFIGVVWVFYKAWQSSIPISEQFHFDVASLIAIVVLMILIFNIWAFFKIAKPKSMCNTM